MVVKTQLSHTLLEAGGGFPGECLSGGGRYRVNGSRLGACRRACQAFIGSHICIVMRHPRLSVECASGSCRRPDTLNVSGRRSRLPADRWIVRGMPSAVCADGIDVQGVDMLDDHLAGGQFHGQIAGRRLIGGGLQTKPPQLALDQLGGEPGVEFLNVHQCHQLVHQVLKAPDGAYAAALEGAVDVLVEGHVREGDHRDHECPTVRGFLDCFPHRCSSAPGPVDRTRSPFGGGAVRAVQPLAFGHAVFSVCNAEPETGGLFHGRRKPSEEGEDAQRQCQRGGFLRSWAVSVALFMVLGTSAQDWDGAGLWSPDGASPVPGHNLR